MKKLLILLLAFGLGIYNCYPQNVGIGVINPTRARLEINGGNGRTVGIFGGETAGISIQKEYPAIGFNQYFDAASKYVGNGYAAVEWFNPTTGNLNFDAFPPGTANATGTSARVLTITKDGNVGIGNAGTDGQLQLNNELRNRKILLYESANNDHQYYGFGINSGTLRYQVDAPGAAHRFYAASGSGSSNLLMTVAGTGQVVFGTQAGVARVGINSGNPQYALEVVQYNHTGIVVIDPATYNNWELKTEVVGSNGNYLFFRYNAGGVSFIQPDGSYHSGSDNRLKEDIRAMPDLLGKLMQLEAKTYRMKYNNDNKRKSIGFLAQDVERFFPELVAVVDGQAVGYKEITDLHTINYAGLSVVAIKAIQEQQKIISDQQKEIDELKAAVAKLIEKRQ